MHCRSVILILLSPCALGAPTTFDAKPWLEDLEQVRITFATKYPDLEWEVFERDVDLTSVFAEARERISAASSAAAAKAALVALTQQFGDRHVQISWKAGDHPADSTNSGLNCAELGYSTGMQAAPLAALMPGAVPLADGRSDPFPVAMLRLHGHSIGILKIPLFMPQAFPEYCAAAVHRLALDTAKPCNEECADRITAAAAAQMTTDFAKALRTLKGAGADVLLVDLADNGGGSEWCEAAVRMVTRIQLQSTPMYFMKGDHWAARLGSTEQSLRLASARAAGSDRQFLLNLAAVVAERKRDAEAPCDGSPLWSGQHPACTWLGEGFYSTGLLRSGETQELRSKPWAPLVFTPLQYPYTEGVWSGPLLVVVNGSTGSAAEQFAAELQDNHAAVIMGSPTIGAGCGQTDGGTPTTLRNSGGVLRIPDCVRMRPGQLNLASGVQPDVLVGFRADDSRRRQATLLEDKLPEALTRVVPQ